MRDSILIVDDDDAIQRLLTDFLTDAGYMVKAVDNGLEALAMLHLTSRRPSLILLDISMPYMDGTAFRHAQQYDPDVATIPVILITAHPRVSEQAATLNVVDYLTKPFDLDHLLHVVARYCRAG